MSFSGLFAMLSLFGSRFLVVPAPFLEKKETVSRVFQPGRARGRAGRGSFGCSWGWIMSIFILLCFLKGRKATLEIRLTTPASKKTLLLFCLEFPGVK